MLILINIKILKKTILIEIVFQKNNYGKYDLSHETLAT